MQESESIEQNVSPQDSFNWYVLKVVSGQEKKIRTYMENEIKRLKCEALIKQILVPSERIYEMRNGKKRIKERSFFPGYLVMHASLIDPEIVHTLRYLPGVMGFLGDMKNGRKTPTPLRKQEVNRILGKMDELEENVEHMEHVFMIGEPVKVLDGPFSGFTGTIQHVHEDKHKLSVMVKIFGRNTPIEINYYQVEKEA